MISDKLIRWILFMLNPFISMLISFKEYTLPYSKNIFWAFCVFYGFTFSLSSESAGADIGVYLLKLQDLHQQYDLTVYDAIVNFQRSQDIDILQPVIAYILSRFTDNQGILTMVYAIIFGFFYSRNIWYIFGLLEGKISFLMKLIIFTLILVIPIWFINGVRMWTAFHVFFYGLLPFIFENKKSKLIFVYLSFFIHFSFIIPISLVFLYRVIGNRLNIFFAAFVFSIFVSSINMGAINTIVDKFVPKSIAERSESYRDENVIQARTSASAARAVNWYVHWKKQGLIWALYLIIFYLFLFGNPQIRIIPEWKRLFSFVLIFFTLGNFLSHIPSGGRFLNFGIFSSLMMVTLYLDQFKEDFKMKRIITILSPAFLLFIIVSIRMGFYSTSISTIIGNPIINMFNVGETMSLNDLIK